MAVRVLLAAVVLAVVARAQSDVADIPSTKVNAGGDKRKEYFRIGPHPGAKKPGKGYGLVVILPGGDGGAGFHGWCKRIYKHAVGKGYIAAQPIAVKWTPKQYVVWPTEKNKVSKQKFSTEAFVEAVIADAREWQKIDPEKVFVLTWSSSGPAAYAMSLAKKKSPTGYFVAMSVFRPGQLPSLKRAKGQAYFIYHSQGDKTCAFQMARDASIRLEKQRAKVKFLEYQGGHGWGHPNVFGNLKAGLTWLEKNHSKPPKPKK